MKPLRPLVENRDVVVVDVGVGRLRTRSAAAPLDNKLHGFSVLILTGTALTPDQEAAIVRDGEYVCHKSENGTSPTESPSHPWPEAYVPPRGLLEMLFEMSGGETVTKGNRGFASMPAPKQREIASKGGKAAHAKGTVHEWKGEEVREAGRKGGMASHRRKPQEDDAR